MRNDIGKKIAEKLLIGLPMEVKMIGLRYFMHRIEESENENYFVTVNW